ncbi:hypothetical protein [Cellulosimicrobium cellulans]|uniref:hypothetical protein n=1 Tax=Cellulosimicrobium cellulans TaxID=1710 RepID=UPI001BA7D349|nr:hypothetical protein [Cellulosimicrobium cellulans]QUB98688.1 hypothetical protein J5A69_13060 [Cellulosimicrobium cellulans]
MRTEVRTRHRLDPDDLAERAQTERDARTPGPRFETRSVLDGPQPARALTRDDALAMIDRLPTGVELGPIGRGGVRDVQAWKGKDLDIDLAIASKFPFLMSQGNLVAVAAAERERHRAAAEHAETQRLVQQADREDLLADGPGSADGPRSLRPQSTSTCRVWHRARMATGFAGTVSGDGRRVWPGACCTDR